MKFSTIVILLLASAIVRTQADDAPTGLDQAQADAPSPTPYAVTSRDANSRVWQRMTYSTSPSGQVVTNVHSYTELATGLHYLKDGQWVESKEEIDILPQGGAAATQGQHQAYFPDDIYQGQIQLVTPDGTQLHSRPIGLSYDDGTNTVLIAELTNSDGVLVGSNQVIYPDAFSGLQADLRYTYTKAGFEQDIVLREQPPTPESLGLNPDTTRLQVLTEFFDPPQPSIQSMDMPEQAGLFLEDQSLGFGAMAMIPGRAFLLGENAAEAGARVSKQWVLLDGRQFLVEEVPVNAIAEGLATLPLPTVQPNPTTTAPTVSKHLTLPPQRLAKTSTTKPMLLARASIPAKGLVLDYQMLNSNQTNYTFQGDSTYYISGYLYLEGTNTFEGGAVLKYTNGATLTFYPSSPPYPSINWQATAYRPVILTAKDDNSVGMAISGSTGIPTNYYASIALQIVGVNTTLANLRIAYAQQAIAIVATSSSSISNAQFINCQNGIVATAGPTIDLRNVLFADVQTNFFVNSGVTVDAQNVTFSGSTNLATGWTSDSGVALLLTNCVLANVASLTNGVLTLSGDHNGFYNCLTFGTGQVTNAFNPFQSVGAGNYYLANGCAFTNAGTTNIDPTLLAVLRQKTTYPPILYSNMTISTPTNWGPVAQRDTDIPNLGYHYDPLDYLISEVTVTNTTLTLTNGVAVGLFGQYGISMNSATGFVYSTGSPTAMNQLLWYPSVQEQSVNLNNVSSAGGSIFYLRGDSPPNGLNLVQMRFTDLPMQGLEQNLFFLLWSQSSAVISLQDCWLRGVNFGIGYIPSEATYSFIPSVTLRNNLVERCTLTFFNGYELIYSGPVG